MQVRLANSRGPAVKTQKRERERERVKHKKLSSNRKHEADWEDALKLVVSIESWKVILFASLIFAEHNTTFSNPGNNLSAPHQPTPATN